MCHMSQVTCHMSGVPRHISYVTCQLPPVTNANSHSRKPSHANSFMELAISLNYAGAGSLKQTTQNKKKIASIQTMSKKVPHTGDTESLGRCGS